RTCLSGNGPRSRARSTTLDAILTRAARCSRWRYPTTRITMWYISLVHKSETEDRTSPNERPGVDAGGPVPFAFVRVRHPSGRELDHTMRLALIISSAICLPAGANPVPRPVLTNAYIASERLVATISPAEARFAGTF